MGYLDSSDLGKKSKSIIKDIIEHGKDLTKELRGKDAEFYKKEILSYIRDKYDSKKDGVKSFKDVMLVMSFEAADTSEEQKMLLQILNKHPHFSKEILPALNAEKLSQIDAIPALSEAMYDKLIDSKTYSDAINLIIDKNIDNGDLHQAVLYELEINGKEDKLSKDLFSRYVNHPKIPDDKMNDALDFWDMIPEKGFVQTSLESDRKSFLAYISEDRKIENPKVKKFILSSIYEDKDAPRVSKKTALNSALELMDIYEDRPDLSRIVLMSFEKIKKHPDISSFADDVFVKSINSDLPEIAKSLIDEINENPKIFLGGASSLIPTVSEYYPALNEEGSKAAAKVIRNTESPESLADMICSEKILDDGFTMDVCSDVNQYLLHVAFNDSKMSAEDALYFSERVLDSMSIVLEDVSSFSDEEDDDEDNDSFFNYGNKDDYLDGDDKVIIDRCTEIINIMNNSSILKSNNKSYTHFIANLKDMELNADLPEQFNSGINSLVKNSLKKIDVPSFVDIVMHNSTRKVSDGDENGAEPNDNALRFVKDLSKQTNFNNEEKEGIIKVIDKYKSFALSKNIKKYDDIINVYGKQKNVSLNHIIRDNSARN